jgi:photosystem II stability/assembly factor-like uncharacterized protein
MLRRLFVLTLLSAAPASLAQPASDEAARPADGALRAANPVPPTPAEARAEALVQRRRLQANSLVGNVPFRSVGPRVMSGRVADLDASPTDAATFYVAYASSGLWKTTSNGTAFTPLFDTLAVMTIGDVAVDWRDPEDDGETIWVGTGESNSSRSSYAGDGVYRSTDGGKTWRHLGLGESHHVGRLLLHPADPNTAWVAALGHLYSPNEERGVYRTTDGGETWERVLFVDENTGAVDLTLDPSNPDRLWAATWTRARRAWDFSEAGPGSAVWRSDDGGATWARVTVEGSGFPMGETIGRIGLAVASDGSLYAVVDNQARRPKEEDEDEPALTREALLAMTREEFLEVAEDVLTDFLDRNNHPLSYTAQSILEMVRDSTIAPVDLVNYLEDANQQLFDTPVVGAEVYRSRDGGATWQKTHEGFLDDLFYSYGYYFGQVRVAPHDPERVYVLGVPLIASSDGGATWESIDGPHVHVDHHALHVSPTRPGHLVSGNDGGVNVSFDDGASWTKANVPAVGQFYAVGYDMAEPYRVYGGLQDNGVWVGPSGYEAGEDWLGEGEYPWKRVLGGDGMQVAVDPRTNRLVYTGFQFGNYFRVDRDAERAERITPRHELGERPLRFNWNTPIHLSTHNPDILYLGSHRVHRSLDGGKTWQVLSEDLTGGGRPGDVPYGTLTSLDESPRRFGLLWAGTDDGRVHLSRDGGYSWTDVSNGLPAELWVSRVEASHHDEARAFAALNGYRWDDFTPHLYRTDDHGATWRRIGRDLPMEPVNVVVEDPNSEELLYVGTDHGIYVSLDGGTTFMALMGQTAGEGRLPEAPVHDLKVHPRDADLIVGTHGRSIWIAAVAHVQALTPELRAEAVHVFDLAPVEHSEGWGERGWSWDEPEEPEVRVGFWARDAGEATIRIRTEAGRVVRTLTDAAEDGLNYVAYDLSVDEALSEEHEPGEDTERYYLLPGTYTVEVNLNGQTAETTLTMEEPPSPPSRGRKKTP